MTSFLAFLLAITILVGVHEYGHYRVAVAFGVRVLRFSLGFGPVIYRSSMGRERVNSSGSSQGETEFVISMIPLGGYVSFLDENSDPELQEDWSRAFHNQSLFKRSLIVLAGPLANFALALVLLVAMNGMGHESARAVVSISSVSSLASRASLSSGETITKAAIKGEVLEPIDAYPQWERLVMKALVAHQDLEIEVLEAPAKTLDPLQGQNAEHKTRDVSLADSEALGQAQGARMARTRRVELALSSFEAQGLDGSREDLNKALDLNAKNVMAQLGFLGPYSPAVIGPVSPGGPAEEAGLRSGDRVLEINHQQVLDAYDLKARIAQSARALVHEESGPLKTIEAQTWTIQRPGEPRTLEILVRPQVKTQDGQLVGRIEAYVGGQFERVWYREDAWSAVQLGCANTWTWTLKTVQSIFDLFTAQAPLSQLGGPLTLAKYAGESVSIGAAAFLSYLALISINLGVFNLLPFPPLDGGHLLLYVWQGITGRAVSQGFGQGFQKVGLFLVLVLSVFALRNDLLRLLGLSP